MRKNNVFYESLDSRGVTTICIWISQRVASDPLVRLCSRLHTVTGTVLSPEGLNKQFNEKSVLFLKHLFSLLLQQKICEQTHISNQLFAHFQRIRIMDATMFQVPNTLDYIYPGFRWMCANSWKQNSIRI